MHLIGQVTKDRVTRTLFDRSFEIVKKINWKSIVHSPWIKMIILNSKVNIVKGEIDADEKFK